ncbi:hypothetical protein [Paenibacillus roseipurpureus]|uniref:Uncharacterized protein n=1 Tax=Paenibacillus roseopurpureus TaxID=2918901 RepID=A0AA96LPB1_9BACL|nr:hypothetical protein [Paenibacillus sp. MBLB1832]WNR43494.1 hypothetical protein MJB10_20645 [Paenibacillus sp. MBLB1832]
MAEEDSLSSGDPDTIGFPTITGGGSGMIGLQDMLLQQRDHVVYIFPTWPKEWDVSFKLNLAGQTIVEAVLVDGKASWTIHSKEYESLEVVCSL